MQTNLEQSVREIMADIFALDATAIDQDSGMNNTPAWDSANHINLVLALEEEFRVTFDVAEIEAMTTFQDVLQTLSHKQ